MEIVYTNNNYLQHHGILGQKWGVRRFQNVDGSYTSAGKKRYGIGASKIIADTKIGGGNGSSQNKSTYDHSTGKDNTLGTAASVLAASAAGGAYIALRFTGNFANVPMGTAIGAAAGTVAAGAILVSSALAKHGEKKILESNKESGEIDVETGFYKKADRQYSQEEDLKATNPGYARYTSDTKNNCVLCTLTYDLRQRGYAVSANYASQGFTSSDVKRWYKDAKVEKGPNILDSFNVRDTNNKDFKEKQKMLIDTVKNSIESEGPGARGYLSTKYFINDSYGKFVGSAGHALVYQVNKEGKIDILDAQTNTVYNGGFDNSELQRTLFDHTLMMDHVRLDNCEIKSENIKEVAHS